MTGHSVQPLSPDVDFYRSPAIYTSGAVWSQCEGAPHLHSPLQQCSCLKARNLYVLRNFEVLVWW